MDGQQNEVFQGGMVASDPLTLSTFEESKNDSFPSTVGDPRWPSLDSTVLFAFRYRYRHRYLALEGSSKAIDPWPGP